MLGPTEIIALGIIAVLLIWGPKKLPEIADSFGKAKKEYKKSMKEAEEFEEELEVEDDE